MRFLFDFFSRKRNVMRSCVDRRRGDDRRKETIYVTYSARKFERRINSENRKNWSRITRWSSSPPSGDVPGIDL